ncbi:MAG TPA: Ig-like domain-containing protein [Longimicrobium sp.]|nr:Ig-like domain-containing protein [Longimicrobium sp.]
MRSLFRSTSRLSLAIPLLAVLGAAACDSPSDSGRGRVPAAVEIVSPNPQAGTAGAPLPAPVAVRVVDDRDRPVAGQAVSFVVTGGGGSVSVPTVTTDAEGLAQVTWTLGTSTAAAQTLEARVANGANTFTAAFTATISAAAPATVTAFPTGDTVRVGTPGAPISDSLAVLVRDAFGNPVPGVQVTWTAATGGGTLGSPTTTDAAGVARSRWTLGSSATEGHQLALGSVAVPGAGTIRFHAHVATTLTKSAGDGITTVAGAVIEPRVLVGGPWGGVRDAEVRWQVTGGGGTVSPAESITGVSGFAGTQWTLGAAGPQTLTATMGGLTVTFTAAVIPQGSRTLVAQVPGTVLDARADRLLWLDTRSGERLVKIRTIGTGADATVKTDTAFGAIPTVEGYLFEGGALVWNLTGQLFEYRGGTLEHLGPGIPSAEGEWAAWSGAAGVIRRNLATGTNLVVAPAGSEADVGPDGDVVFLDGGSGWLYSGGALSQVTLETSTFGPAPADIATDGVNVVYVMRSVVFSSAELLLDRPGGDERLASHSSKSGGIVHYRLNGGWVAYNTPLADVKRRSPGGSVETVTTEATGLRLEALGPDGTLIHSGPGSRYFLVPPDGSRRDAGPAESGERIVWRGDRFLLISGGSVYRLAA